MVLNVVVGKVSRHFGLSQLGVRVLLASSESMPGILQNILQGTGQLPTTSSHLA